MRGYRVPEADERLLVPGRLVVRGPRGLEVRVSLIVLGAAPGEFILRPSGEVLIRGGRGLPGAGQRLKHLPG